MKKLIYIVIMNLMLGLNSCSSPLSDTPVSDPGLITPNIIVVHTDDDYGISNTVRACLTDKNGAYIELLEGDVKVNDDLMEYSVSCYKRTIDVKEEENYEIVVTLADSTEYPFKVKTPAFFKKVDYPSKIKKNEVFDVSWKSNEEMETVVSFSVQDTTGSMIILYEELTSNSYVTVDPDNFPKYDIKSGTLTLYRKIQGSMPDGFSGGSIESRCIFERTIKIK
ncbi:MAG: hypothetical protein H6598_03690 [Flavobacteriales bacterium]|nr:hypothetical protein [Flavobacteriales bacterium]